MLPLEAVLVVLLAEGVVIVVAVAGTGTTETVTVAYAQLVLWSRSLDKMGTITECSGRDAALGIDSSKEFLGCF